MAADSQAHERLLGELRKTSVGPPIIPEETDPVPLSVGLSSLLPLILGFFRTDMVRGLLTFLLGASLAAAGALDYLRGGQELMLPLGAIGCGLIFWVVGPLPLPGGVPFMEVKTPSGFHCIEIRRNKRLKRAFDGWMAGFQPTAWIRTGEWCTILPFFWTENKAKDLQYERVWVQNPNDKEHLANDWVFPPGGYDPARPVVLLLTGLAPDKHWTQAGGFVANTAWDLTTQSGMTVLVVVSRGTMDTSVKEHPLQGGGYTDIRQAVLSAERAMRVARGEKEGSKAPLPLFASGFSMGAITIANYCGKFGADCRLAGVVHFSGIYDGIFNMGFEYSNKTWQTYLAYGLKVNLLNGRVGRLGAKRGADMSVVLSPQVESVTDVDIHFVSVVNGYKDGVKGYYRDLTLKWEDKWKNVKVPVLAIAARDDPITHCDALHAVEFSSGNDNLLFLITDRGGHVGWPWSNHPWKRGFDFMSGSISVFVETLLADS